MQFQNIDEYLQHWLGEAPDPELCKPADYFRGRMEEFSRERHEPGCVVMLGDSLTDFAGDWSVYLPGWNVVNRGIAGDMIEGMELRLGEIASLHPSQLYVLAGCNNFVKHPGISAEDVWQIYEHFLDSIRTTLQGVPLHIISLLPMHSICPDYTDFNPKAEKMNTYLREAAPRYGYEYIDLATPLKDEAGDLKTKYTIDGCHLNEKGFRIWADLILKTK